MTLETFLGVAVAGFAGFGMLCFAVGAAFGARELFRMLVRARRDAAIVEFRIRSDVPMPDDTTRRIDSVYKGKRADVQREIARLIGAELAAWRQEQESKQGAKH